ncbi:unnamed protein product [Penicillium nalgiovense]|nr:unnamed protein product [Penicillium nalgiovense]
MGDPEIISASALVGSLGDRKEIEVIKVQNEDELRLAQMGRFPIPCDWGYGIDPDTGHKQELERHFSLWSLIGLAANCTISWTVIYGFILVFTLQSFVGASLAEFVSAYPTEGGMYHWIAAIAPKRYNSLLSFATGWCTVFGWIFTTASTNLIYATAAMALIALYHDGLVVQPWMTFVAYQILNILTAGVVMFGNRFIPIINKFSSITLSIAFVTGLSYLLSLMFSVQDYGSLADTHTGLPLAELFWQATSTRGGAFGLVFMVWVALGPCVIGSQLSTGRVFWAFSRDEGLPLSKIWARVHPKLGSPFNAQLCVAVIVSLLGCIYLGSSTAFNAMMSSAVTINNFAYLVPILTNVILLRRTMHRGPFFMGQTVGMSVNIIAVAWLVFAIVFFSFPYQMPVTVSNMNYTCVVVGGFLTIELAWWLIAGKRYSATVQRAREEVTSETVVIADGKSDE